MNDHLDPILERYLDGELRPEQARAAQEHLGGCPDCRARLERLMALRALLAEAPAAEGLKSEARFTAEVGLRMERRAPAPAAPSVGEILWHLVPVGLMAALAFVEAVMLVSTLVSWIPGAESALGSLAPSTGLGAFLLPLVGGDFAETLGGLSFSVWNPLTATAVLAAAGLIALGWLASWYVRSQKSEPGLK